MSFQSIPLTTVFSTKTLIYAILQIIGKVVPRTVHVKMNLEYIGLEAMEMKFRVNIDVLE